MIAQFEFKRKINHKGYYATIVLDIQESDTEGIELVFDKYSEWYATLNYGVTYLSEHILDGQNDKRGYRIVINELNTMIIDSGSIVVLYVFIKAFFEALGYNTELIEINDEGCLVLPK